MFFLIIFLTTSLVEHGVLFLVGHGWAIVWFTTFNRGIYQILYKRQTKIYMIPAVQ